MNIKNVVVIGSGTMGSGIAAQLCNANVSVTLLDLKTEISEEAKKKIYESRPPLLVDKKKIDNLKVGNIDDNFDTVKKADWVVEAVVEAVDGEAGRREPVTDGLEMREWGLDAPPAKLVTRLPSCIGARVATDP